MNERKSSRRTQDVGFRHSSSIPPPQSLTTLGDEAYIRPSSCSLPQNPLLTNVIINAGFLIVGVSAAQPRSNLASTHSTSFSSPARGSWANTRANLERLATDLLTPQFLVRWVQWLR